MNKTVNYRSASSINPPPTAPNFDTILSSAALVLLIATAIAFACYVPYHRQKTLVIFEDFGVNLPASARVAASVPTWSIIASAAIVLAAALIIQARAKSKRSAALFHLLMTILLGVLFVAYREAMGSAMTSLIETIN